MFSARGHSLRRTCGPAALVLVALLVMFPARAATPEGAKLGPNQTVSWSGGPLIGSGPSQTNTVCRNNVNCDDFLLDIQVPPSAYALPKRPVVEVNVATTEPNNVQLILIEPGADKSPPSTEYTKAGVRAFISSPKQGQWTIRIACTACAGATYTASARSFGFVRPLPSVGSTFQTALKLAGADGGTEPRITFDRNDTGWIVTNRLDGTAVVYRSDDHGKKWNPAAGIPAAQTAPTIDVDIVAAANRRLIATELDLAGVNFPTSYSDDGGATWTLSLGTLLVDMDRQWLAVGPNNRVYLLYHNLFTGTGTHNMWVMTSTDNGATFAEPVPITLPGSQAFLDLQCSDSGGPSSLAVNQETGRVYAFWGTRSSATGGGCTAEPIEANIVAATKVWVAMSPDATPGSWTLSTATDSTDSGKIVGMQLSPGTLDNAGNVWVTYPESPHPYPNYDGAAIKVRWAPPDLSRWSAPITIAPEGGAGNVLTHIVAGDAGKIAVAYFHGVAADGVAPTWYLNIARSYDAMSASPHVIDETVSPVGAYSGTASQLMGACSGSGPLAGVENGYTCGRATDVWGIALDGRCMVHVVWPTVAGGGSASGAGTYVSSQASGAPLCGSAASATSHRRTNVLGNRRTLPNTGVGDGAVVWGLALLASAVAVASRLRRA